MPVEVVPYGSNFLFSKFEKMKFNPSFRKFEGKNFITDGGHFIIDLNLKVIDDLIRLEKELKKYAGIVEVGLFTGIADMVIAGKGENVEILKK